MSYRSRYSRKSARTTARRTGHRSYGSTPHRRDFHREYCSARDAHRSNKHGGNARYYPQQRAYRHYPKSSYKRYTYPQPSGSVYVEEPETEDDASSASDYDGCAQLEDEYPVYRDVYPEEELYESDVSLDSNDSGVIVDSEFDSEDSDSAEGFEEIFVIPNYDEDIIDLNDVLEKQFYDELEAQGLVEDVNDELVRFYDSASDSDSSISSGTSSDSDSYTDLGLDTDEELEFLRQVLSKNKKSKDFDSDNDPDDVFIEVDSDFYESDSDIAVDFHLSDDEGMTIYRHQSDSESSSSDDEYDPENELKADLLMAHDSDDEYEVIDLSKDLKDSKDCEVVELDDHTYKMNLRLPSLIPEDLDIKFFKKENELVITGKFNFNIDDSDSEFEDDDDVSAEVHVEEASSDSDSDSDSPFSDSFSSSSSSSSSSESDDETADSAKELASDNEEEIVEDAQNLTKEFKNHEIQFEKGYKFDKIIKFDQIKATFLDNGELELIVPNEGLPTSDDNIISIAIKGLAPSAIAAAEGETVEAVAEDAMEA